MDALIMEPDIPVETFLDDSFDLIIAYGNLHICWIPCEPASRLAFMATGLALEPADCFPGAGVQAGVYFIRNTHWSHMFLLEVSFTLLCMISYLGC
jgi:hypothetical protein